MALCLKVAGKSWETLWATPGALGRLAKMFSVHFGFLVVNPVFCRLPFWDTQQLGFSFLLQHVATMILAMDNSWPRFASAKSGPGGKLLALLHSIWSPSSWLSPQFLEVGIFCKDCEYCRERGRRTSGVCEQQWATCDLLRCVTWPLRLWTVTRCIFCRMMVLLDDLRMLSPVTGRVMRSHFCAKEAKGGRGVTSDISWLNNLHRDRLWHRLPLAREASQPTPRQQAPSLWLSRHEHRDVLDISCFCCVYNLQKSNLVEDVEVHHTRNTS